MSGHMIGSPLDLAPDPAFAARRARHRALDEVYGRPDAIDGPEHVLVGERQEGKTTLALAWLLDAPDGIKRVLVVRDVDTADRLKREHGLKRTDDRIRSFRQIAGGGARRDVEYGIDESADILAQLLSIPTPHLLTVCTAAPWQGSDREREPKR
jgi:hypothetical protein